MPTHSRIPRHSERFKGRDLGDEYLFYDRQGDRVHVLNASARVIYLLCDGKKTEEQVIRDFAETYRLDAETARRDGTETVRSLVELGLLSLS